MKMMRAAVLYGPEDVRMEEIPVPQTGPGELLIRVRAALTCGTDAKVFRRGGHPTMIRPPSPFGHEFAGEVEEVGEGVDRFKVGMRVVAANSAPCGTCRYCRMGRESLCDDIIYINGAYAEYIKLPERIVRRNTHEIPEHVSFQQAALVEPLACVLHGFEESNVRIGDTVVINGVGPIGLMFVKLAKLRNARVIATDVLPERLDIAEKIGADHVVNASEISDQVQAVRELTENGEGADVAIDATGSPELWEAALKMLRKGGLANLFGGCAPGTSINVDTGLLHYSELTIKGVYHHTPYYVREALDLIASDQIDGPHFITQEMPLDRVSEALKLIIDHVGVKTAVIP